MKCTKELAEMAVILVFIVSFPVGTSLAQRCPKLVGRWPYGPTCAVTVSGGNAYFGSGTVASALNFDEAQRFRLWSGTSDPEGAGYKLRGQVKGGYLE